MNKSNYYNDKHFEELSTYILQNKTCIFDDLGIFEVINDKGRQIQGIDYIGSVDGIISNIDSKFIACSIPTFSMEISGNKHSGQMGWLINDNLKTDYYLLVYFTVKGYEHDYYLAKNTMTMQNIQKIEGYLIKKEKIRNIIEARFGDLHDYANKIRAMNIESNKTMRFDENMQIVTNTKYLDMYCAISCGIYEQPINIIVKRSILSDIATMEWNIDIKQNEENPVPSLSDLHMNNWLLEKQSDAFKNAYYNDNYKMEIIYETEKAINIVIYNDEDISDKWNMWLPKSQIHYPS